jgi:hypothetical protein
MIKYFLILLTLAFAGCDLFSTRTAEPPTQARSNFQQPSTPDILIQDLVNSLQDKNVQNYISCLSDPAFTKATFTFSPSSSALSDNWGIKNEEQYFNNLKLKVPTDVPIVLNLTNVSFTPQGDSIFYSASYTLLVSTQDPNLPQNYQGDLRFNMIRDSRAVWSIYYWQDSKNSQLPTWSELKGRTY